MGKFARHQPQGNITRDVQRVAKRTKLEGTARSLAASTLGDGGEFAIQGDMIVSSPGRFIARYPSEKISTILGPLRAASDPDDLFGDGLLVQRDDVGGFQPDIAQIAQYADGSARAYFGYNGTPLTPIDVFSVRASLIYLRAQGNQGVAGASTGLHLLSDDNTVYISHTTSGGSANAILDPTTGLITRASSAERYKADIKPLELDVDEFLRLEPVTFVDRHPPRINADEDAPVPVRHVGFVAERLIAQGGGLEQFVSHVATGDGGTQPEGIAYDRLMGGAVKVMQRQQRELNDLTDTVTALTARLDALEAQRGG